VTEGIIVIRMKILGLKGIVARGRIRNLIELQVLSLLICYRFSIISINRD
jgi:uncharacterized MnhB-related membrane protein